MRRASVTLLSCLVVPSLAFSVPFRRAPHPTSSRIEFSSKGSSGNNTFGFENVQNIQGADIYVVELSLNGQNFEVQLDTGSSDLWLDTTHANVSPGSNLESTGLTTGLSYGDGTVAEGPVLIANITLGNFTVQQAFISAPGTNATTNSDTGLLGIGPPSLSAISQTLDDTQFNGKTLMENIFASNPSDPNFITFQLSRSQSTGTTDGGVFSIGEVDQDFSSVSSAPKLPVIRTDRWVVLMDGMIVNNKTISGNSNFNVAGQSSGQTLANLDSGTGLAQIPQFYMDAIYSDIPGAQFLADQGMYILPCDAKIDVSFIFGGVNIPIHPIDTVAAGLDQNNNVQCFSGFPASDGTSDSEDFLLGDSFLRNTYSLFDYGSLVSGSTPPFIQLLGTTTPSTADGEFSSLSSTRNASLTGKGSSSGSTSGSLTRVSGSSAALISVVGFVVGLVTL